MHLYNYYTDYRTVPFVEPLVRGCPDLPMILWSEVHHAAYLNSFYDSYGHTGQEQHLFERAKWIDSAFQLTKQVSLQVLESRSISANRWPYGKDEIGRNAAYQARRQLDFVQIPYWRLFHFRTVVPTENPLWVSPQETPIKRLRPNGSLDQPDADKIDVLDQYSRVVYGKKSDIDRLRSLIARNLDIESAKTVLELVRWPLGPTLSVAKKQQKHARDAQSRVLEAAMEHFPPCHVPSIRKLTEVLAPQGKNIAARVSLTLEQKWHVAPMVFLFKSLWQFFETSENDLCVEHTLRLSAYELIQALAEDYHLVEPPPPEEVIAAVHANKTLGRKLLIEYVQARALLARFSDQQDTYDQIVSVMDECYPDAEVGEVEMELNRFLDQRRHHGETLRTMVGYTSSALLEQRAAPYMGVHPSTVRLIPAFKMGIDGCRSLPPLEELGLTKTSDVKQTQPPRARRA